MHKTLLVAGVLVVCIAGTAVLLVSNKDIFMVQNIQLRADFALNKNDFIKKTGLRNHLYIWQYDPLRLGKRIEMIPYIDEYSIERILPSSVRIVLKMRKPVARICGKDGVIYFIDRRGYVYRSEVSQESIPLLLVPDRGSIENGKKLTGAYEEILNTLWGFKKKYATLYRSLSQIEMNSFEYYKVFTVDFRTINKTITLKNSINVENIVEGLAAALVCDKQDAVQETLYGIGNGFFLNGRSN